VTTDAAKHLCFFHQSEPARHLLLDLDHPEIVVSLVVGEKWGLVDEHHVGGDESYRGPILALA
jgi:hypothetical protein